MTPKEKAEEIYTKFVRMESHCDDAQECALIAVDEIIKVCHYNSKENLSNWELVGLDDFEFSCYWNEVKEEIEKL